MTVATAPPLAWEHRTYPARPFVRHRADTDAPLRVARVGRRDAGPLVSFLLPTLDGDRDGRLARLLDDLHAQTWTDWELVAVLGDRRQGRAINAAAALAGGRLLVTLDDDTALVEPRAVECLVEAVEADAAIGLAGGVNIVPPGAPWLAARAMREIPRRSTPPVAGVTDSDLAEHPLLLARRDVFEAVGGENELIPRGLDPYLREAVRAAGYRVVIAPGAFYGHLPPTTAGGLLRQFFRNGRAAAFVARCHPEWLIETPSRHGPFRARRPWPLRALRVPARMALAAATGRPVWLACQMAYVAGWLCERVVPGDH